MQTGLKYLRDQGARCHSAAQAAMQALASTSGVVELQQLSSQKSGSVLMHCMELQVVDSTVGRMLPTASADWLAGGWKLPSTRPAGMVPV